MSSCAVLLVKDEIDVIEYTLRHLAAHVDEVVVADNLSTDGTLEALRDLERELPLRVVVDDEVGYYQSRKTSALALAQLGRHDWVVPCDADEAWHCNEVERRIGDFLDGLAPDVMIVEASLYHHIPSALDPPASCDACGSTGVEPGAVSAADLGPVACYECGGRVEPNPLRRIGWRKRERGALPKVACRLRPDLVIEAGNHDATTSGTAVRAGGLSVRHFSWRSPEQFLKKIRNGERAYAATNLPMLTGEHWRVWTDKPDEAITDHFKLWFWSEDPRRDASLIYDPAPLAG